MLKDNYLSVFKRKTVLITGSTGFKGSWLSYWLHKLGAKVIGVGLKPEKNFILFKALKLKKLIKQHYFDISNFNKLDQLIKKNNPNFIFHLAAQSIVSQSYFDPLKTINANTLGSANILECVRVNKIKNLVYITSDKCYYNVEKKRGYKENDLLGGIDNYSSSKAAAEILFHSYHHSFFKNKFLSHASARAGNVIGGGDMKKNRIIPDLIKSLRYKKKLILRNPNSTRPWQHVLEPLYGYLKLGSLMFQRKLTNIKYPSWNFGPYPKNCVNVAYIVNQISKSWSKKKIKIKLSKKSNFKESKLLSLNITKAQTQLNWRPRLSLKETIKLTSDWYKFYYKKKDMREITNSQINFFLRKK